ncbi:MAG: DUF4167 domain-containing protein [Rhodospirillaceae bacterium]|nr:DUF4167 domain-containing protein [Rhodospirillaceae bacterium]MBT5374933.1 DUF4167 domain-containing protein [Rhodospirillaceae bacterium]MBT5660245.1 DUF4167 domain-containing protein [Rhodospirillaceae bacterium]MBT5752384.1 DUF4167 domain-containing protein [Rhodospirillaceae bacterium]
MKQGSHIRRSRGRNNGPRKSGGGFSRNQVFDSNGPDVKVRGNVTQVLEKYLNLAQDATSAGDRIAAEGYYQYAEHYQRRISDLEEEAAKTRSNENRDENAKEGKPQADDAANRSDQGRNDRNENNRSRNAQSKDDRNENNRNRNAQNRTAQGRNDRNENNRGGNGSGGNGSDGNGSDGAQALEAFPETPSLETSSPEPEKAKTAPDEKIVPSE